MSKLGVRVAAILALVQLVGLRQVDAKASTTNGLWVETHDITQQIIRMQHAALGSDLFLAEGRGFPTRAFVASAAGRYTPFDTNAVTIELQPCAATDGVSTCFQATIHNNSGQELTGFDFPDLRGLQAIGGEAKKGEVELRMALGVINPFVGPDFKREYAGGIYQPYALRWIDYGTMRGGISIFEETYGSEYHDVGPDTVTPRPSLIVERTTVDPQTQKAHLRLAWRHHVRIPDGGVHTTNRFVFTPHHGGWAKGIVPFKNFIQAQYASRRTVPLPESVRDALAVQTVTMLQSLDASYAAKPDFMISDISRIAADALEHGIKNVVLWGATQYSRLPILLDRRVVDWTGCNLAGPRSERTYSDGRDFAFQQYRQQVLQARASGVEMIPFINIQIPKEKLVANVNYAQMSPTRGNDSCEPTASAEYMHNFHQSQRLVEGQPYITARDWKYLPSQWSYHTEMIPAINDPNRVIAENDISPLLQSTYPADPNSYRATAETFKAHWQTEWSSRGLGSLCMDVTNDDGTYNMRDTLNAIRGQMPGAVIAGEPDTMNMERAALFLDFTWSWLDYIDAGPYNATLRYPRIAINVDSSIRTLKMAFIDGTLVNLMPRKRGGTNGSMLIAQDPILSATVKRLTAARARFAAYFIRGDFIGGSILAEPVEAFERTNKSRYLGGATVDLGPLEYRKRFIKAYQSKDNTLLVAILNNGAGTESLSFQTNLSDWLSFDASAPLEQMSVRAYDESGTELGSSAAGCSLSRVGGNIVVTTHALAPLELVLCEISPNP